MATMAVYGGIDVAAAPYWTVFTATGDDSQLSISDSEKAQSFYGSFRYGSGFSVSGTVKEISFGIYYTTKSYHISDVTLDAATVQQLILNQPPSAFYAYVLGGNDTIIASDGSEGGAARGYGGDDLLVSSLWGHRLIDGGAGSDTLQIKYFPHAVIADLGAASVQSRDGTDTGELTLLSIENLQGTTRDDLLIGDAGSNRLDGDDGIDTVSYFRATGAVQVDLATGTATGGGGSDQLVSIENVVGGSAGDLLTGTAAANLLDGGEGVDTLVGGAGDDVYLVTAGDQIVELADDGVDTVRVSISYVLGAIHVERLELDGSDNLSATGNDAANVVVGNTGGNLLSGLAGADTLVGGAGDDTLKGDAGADALRGGAGDDRYWIDDASDTVTELAEGGADTVFANVSVTLAGQVEDLVLLGDAALAGTGNGLANRITGNVSANTLSGGAGADTLIGGAGNDLYLAASADDQCIERADGGVDTIRATLSWVLGAAIENLVLAGSTVIDGSGNALANVLTGNAAANVLDGKGGADTMIGGAGSDTYVVDSAGDVLQEAAGGGIDTVRVGFSWTLAADFENLVLTGASAIDGTGNARANTLTGNGAANRLDGGAGNDTMQGGAGSDTYFVDARGDVIVEAVGAGIDTVVATADTTLSAHVERLTLAGSADLAGTGNTLANRIVGNAGANRLDGGGSADADSLIGGAGDDTYLNVWRNDVITEWADGGTDTVMVFESWTLGATIENATLLAPTDPWAVRSLTGNTGANVLTGANSDDVLDGGAGADTMAGGLGRDVYYVDNPGDVIVDFTSDPYPDRVLSTISWTLASGFGELQLLGSDSLTGIGNAASNTLRGNAGANRLDGGAGYDTMYGGDGDDIYVVTSAGDTVREESATGGVDLVLTSISYWLRSQIHGEWIENLTLTGTGNLTGWGSDADNVITGNAGNNQLAGDAGIDTVSYANATHGVAVNLRSGIATGFGSDTLQTFENVLGSSYNDTLRGDDGANVLEGGDGADRFILDSALATDTIVDFTSGVDQLRLSRGTLPIGDGDLAVEGAVAITGPGGFAADAELVVVQSSVTGPLGTASAAAAIGSATSAYAAGRTALFVVHDASQTALYGFTSSATDATVGADELLLLATLQGTTSTALADFGFVA